MKITKLSASGYETHNWCEWKYTLNYLFGFEDGSIPSGIIGSICHKVLEILSRACMLAHDKKSKIWDIEYLWKICFNRCYNDEPEVAARVDGKKLQKACKGVHELLASSSTPIRDNTIGAETYFRIPLKEKRFKIGEDYLKITGKIDRIDKISEDTIEIVDYKTGSRSGFLTQDKEKKNSSMLMEDIQPRLYHLAAKELYPWAKNILVTFIYITDGGAVSIPFSDDDVTQTKTMVYNKFASIKDNNEPQQNRSWKCKSLCSYGKNGVCENVWKEKNELGFEFIQDKYVSLNIIRKKR